MTIHLLAHIDRNMLLGFSPQIIKDLAINNAQYGFLAGAVWVLSFGVMAMIMGALADRFSRTRIIAAGILIWSVCTWASGHAQSFEQMAIARFFVASGEAALVPAAVSLLAELFPEKRRGTAMGLFFMGIPLGIGCSFLLAGTPRCLPRLARHLLHSGRDRRRYRRTAGIAKGTSRPTQTAGTWRSRHATGPGRPSADQGTTARFASPLLASC
ncbi:MFS transporter [Cupriavidus basilensis]